jgi:DNA-binding IclR family transcriptional regulator
MAGAPPSGRKRGPTGGAHSQAVAAAGETSPDFIGCGQTGNEGFGTLKSGDRLLSLLWLFSPERPVLEVEEIARTMEISLSTAYRDVSRLCEAGFLEPIGSLGYALGPAIIELDRNIRLADPLVQVARAVQQRLLADIDPAATVLLCRLYRNQVMCVAQSVGKAAHTAPSYERGRLMPMLRGAPAKAILAHLPSRAAERLWEVESQGGQSEPSDWQVFREHLARIRKAGVVVSHSEVQSKMVGVAACIFNGQGKPIGSICAALPAEGATPPAIARVSALTRASADEITATLVEREASHQGPRKRPSSADAAPAAASAK